MKYMILLSLFCAILGCSNSKIKNVGDSKAEPGVAATDSSYPLAVSFGSMCCGTASPDFLKSFIKSFNKKNGSKISADIAGACGKEGEFVILFKMQESKGITSTFKTELEALVVKTDASNRKVNTSSGGISVLQDAKTTEFQYCRLGITTWELK